MRSTCWSPNSHKPRHLGKKGVPLAPREGQYFRLLQGMLGRGITLLAEGASLSLTCYHTGNSLLPNYNSSVGDFSILIYSHIIKAAFKPAAVFETHVHAVCVRIRTLAGESNRG